MRAIVLKAVDDYLARSAHQAMVRRPAKEQAAKWAELLERSLAIAVATGEPEGAGEIAEFPREPAEPAG